MEFNTNIDDVKIIIIENSQNIKSLENCCDDSFRNELQKLNDEMMKERLGHGEKLIRIKEKQKRIDVILQKAADEADTVEEFEGTYAELLKKEDKKRINVKQTAEYKEFNRDVTGTTRNLDDENMVEVLETGVSTVSMQDPWTKAVMKNPVRNTKCGHNYDRDTVTALIKDTISVRCPVVGCTNKAFIQLQHLEAAEDLRSNIRAHLAEQEMMKSSSEEEN